MRQKIWDKERYKLKLIVSDGAIHASIDGCNGYQVSSKRKEPVGELFPYRDKHRKRFQILKKLGLWENGRILPRERNQTSLDLL